MTFSSPQFSNPVEYHLPTLSYWSVGLGSAAGVLHIVEMKPVLFIYAIFIRTFFYLLGPTNAEDDDDGMSEMSSDSSGSFTSDDGLIPLDEPEDDDLMELDEVGGSFHQTSGELHL